jgi:two-component system nitrogen regulation sensor histidine kinase NtrY
VEKQNLPKQRRISPWILGVFVLISLTVLVLLQTSNLWKDFSVETASDTLLLYALSSLNFIAFVIFGFIFLRSIIKLARERRAFQLGAKIKTRLLLYFAMISLLPIIAMAGFSYLFMNRAMERWFSQVPENVVRQSQKVQTQAIADQSAKLQETAEMLATVLDKRDLSNADLRAIAEAGNLTRIEVLSQDNRTLELSEKPLSAEHKTELEGTIQLIRNGSINEPLLSDGQGFDAAVAQMSGGRKLLIVPDLRTAESVSQMVNSSLEEFDRLKDKNFTVRQVGFLTLGVLTFLLIFASSWTAFYIARGITAPIKALAEGADEIAQGNLSHRVDVLAEDELALLVDAFNQMSGKLEENSAELKERRRYIETVLQSLPTGVISLDGDDRVTTINHAAISILKLENADFTELALGKLVNEENRTTLERVISRAKRIGHASEQTVLQRESSNGGSEADSSLAVALTATALADQNGAVVVIEDLSELIAAQRASAWQEVARRMAHEIKNPLTPIQLSAERIAKRFVDAETRRRGDTVLSEPPAVAGGLSWAKTNLGANADKPSPEEQTSKVVKEGTDTILREVQSLKSMVDEFSRFARLPNAKLEAGDLNEIVRQVLTLYQDRLDEVKIKSTVAEDLPETMIDAEQLKRVFVNLIDNAIEAFSEDSEEKTIMLTTRHETARDLIVAEVADNGKGIDPGDFQKLFQPYFSTKGRGTGLGLAIVRRIVSDHGGRINVVANVPNGAKFIIELPVSA